MIRVSGSGLRWLAPLLLAGFAAACGDEIPIAPSPPRNSVTETFAGTLMPNDGETFPFSSQSGLVTATIMNVAPDDTLTLGLSLGTWNGVSCAIVLVNDKAMEGIPLTGTVNTSGNLCVRVFDVGAVTEPLTYELRVVHF